MSYCRIKSQGISVIIFTKNYTSRSEVKVKLTKLFFASNCYLSFSTYKSYVRTQGNPARGIIDGDLVWRYLYLPNNEKIDVAKKIGTRVQEIIEDLTEIDRLTAHF